jgi:large repetitive protein
VYDPWGTVLSSDGMLGELGFQSAFTDADTGRVNMLARWYDPVTAAFDTRDAANVSPVGDSIAANRYAYASANPLTNIDPDGAWSIRGAFKSVAKTVTKAAKVVVNTAVSVAKAVYNNVILPVVKAVVNVVKTVVNAVVNVVKSAANWVRSTVSKAASWVAQKTAAARAWVAQKAAAARAAAARVYQAAKQAAVAELARVQRVYSEARQKIADAYQASAAWVAEHKDTLIEIAAFGAGIVAGLACTAATGGVGAVACMAGSMALINLAKDAAQGNIHDLGDALGSLGTGALQGAIGGAGGVVGGKVAAFAAGKLGGLAATLGGRVVVGALAGGVEDAATGPPRKIRTGV